VKSFIGRIRLRYLGDKIAASAHPKSVPTMVRFYAKDEAEARSFFSLYYWHLYALDLKPSEFIVSDKNVTYDLEVPKP
jgi:hypothetical protein